MRFAYVIIIVIFIASISYAGTEVDYDDFEIDIISGGTEVQYNDFEIDMFAGATDPCDCPGLNQNWELDHSDACTINDDCNLGTGKLSFTGTGTTIINATINTTELGDPGVNGLVLINANGHIDVK